MEEIAVLKIVVRNQIFAVAVGAHTHIGVVWVAAGATLSTHNDAASSAVMADWRKQRGVRCNFHWAKLALAYRLCVRSKWSSLHSMHAVALLSSTH